MELYLLYIQHFNWNLSSDLEDAVAKECLHLEMLTTVQITNAICLLTYWFCDFCVCPGLA